MASQAWDPRLYLLSTAVASLHCQTQLLMWVLGVQTQILVFVQCKLSVLSSPAGPTSAASSHVLPCISPAGCVLRASQLEDPFFFLPLLFSLNCEVQLYQRLWYIVVLGHPAMSSTLFGV